MVEMEWNCNTKMIRKVKVFNEWKAFENLVYSTLLFLNSFSE